MTQYYLTFTGSNGQTLTVDGSALFAIANFDFSTLQTLNIGPQSGGAGAGKIAFEPFTFTLGTSALTQQLDQWLASGTRLAEINLIGYDTVGGKQVEVIHDAFKDVAITSDAVDAGDGAHKFAVAYGGLVESATPISPTGVQGAPVVDGWNVVNNVEDKSLTTGVGSPQTTALPPLDPTKANPAASAKPEDMYVRFLDNLGNVVGSGWVELEGATFGVANTLNLGAGAGQTTFGPLKLTFAPGTLEPTLLRMEAAGTLFRQIDVAIYGGALGVLTTDYRFETAGIASSDKSAAGDGSVTYTFDYGTEQIATYASPGATPIVEGWSLVGNTADKTDFSPDGLLQAETDVQDALVKTATGENDATQYYLAFTDSAGATFTGDGSPLYQITDFDLSVLQTLNIGLASTGTGAGKVTFEPFTFTLGASRLTQSLDQWLASGKALDAIHLVGYDTVNNKQVQILDDAFKLVGLKSDSIDFSDGDHSFAVEYGGLVESATPLDSAGVQGTPVVDGWNATTGAQDTNLDTTITGGAITLPTLNPATAVAPASPTPQEMFVRFLDGRGNVLGSGWTQLTGAGFGLSQTLNIGAVSGGAGAGEVTFKPLTLTFAPGTLEPTLLNDEAAGVTFKQIDVAVYSNATNALTQDYRFTTAAIASSDKSSDAPGEVAYTFAYGAEQIANYSTPGATPTVQGWDRTNNIALPSFAAGVAPATSVIVQTKLADTGTGEGAATQYYLTFTDASGATFTADGNALYKIDDFDASVLQTLNIGLQSGGAGAGKVSFEPFTFTLGAGQLTEKLDQMLASGSPFAEINLIGYINDGGNQVQVVHDAFKDVGVKSDAIDASDREHAISVEYGGLVESATPITSGGAQGAPVVNGWNAVDNKSDTSLSTGVGGLTNVTLPALDPAKAVPAPSATAQDMYVRFLDNSNNVVGGGWIELTGASFGLEQTLNIGSQSVGTGAGKVIFDPLKLSFAPGTLEPTLLEMEAAGKPLQQLDVAVYSATGALTQDYRFGVVAFATSDKTAADQGEVTYTLQYGIEQVANYANGAIVMPAQGWNRITNASDTSFTTGVTPLTEASVRSKLANLATGEGQAVACFTGGVRLRTDRGEVAVETLKVGDRLPTLSGETKPIVWIGRRRYVCGGHPEPEKVWPVVIAAGALGEGLPVRDLVVSPDHAIYWDGRLIQAARLVNGATIRQAPVAEVDYWHVELPAHDIVHAEGLMTETYLDTGNRTTFEGAGMAAHPDFEPKTWDQTCVPYLSDQELPALRQRLLDRVENFGFAFDDEPELHALADGRSIAPVRLSEQRYAFVFPEGVRQALLVSRTWRPREATPGNQDPRTLGVCIGRLDVDGSTLDLADERLSEGWSYNEPEHHQRWTNGRAVLPAGLRIALLDVCGVGRYLRRPRPFALEA